MDRITIAEVAERAGVSIATVSRVLNGKHVKPAFEEKVLASMRSLDYRPNPAADFSGIASTRNLAMLVPNLANDFYARIANSAIMRARDYGRSIIVSSCDGNQQLEATMLEQLSAARIDALLYCPVSSSELLPDFELLRHLPVVAFARRNVLPGRPHVYSDNVKGGYISTKYLQRLGRKRIAMLMGFWRQEKMFGSSEQVIACLGTPICGAYSSLDRLEGHRQALAEEGIKLSPDMIQNSGYDFGSGYEAAKALMARMVPVDAIIAPNDAVAAGVVRFLSEQRLAVPEEISVIGYDDSAIAMMTTPTLTSIRQDMRLIGSAVVEQAMKLIGGSPAEDVVVEVSLSIGKSTCGT